MQIAFKVKKNTVVEEIIICIRICYEQLLTPRCGILCIRHKICIEQIQTYQQIKENNNKK